MRILSRILVMTVAIGLVMGSSIPPAEAAESQVAKFNILINGSLLVLPEGEQAPEIIDDRAYVPLRVVSENLGARVDWIPATRQVIISRKDINATPFSNGKEGEIEIIIDGNTLDIPEGYGKAFIKQGRTVIPLRAVSEALDCDVDWENDSRTAVIKSIIVDPPVVIEPVPVVPVVEVDPQLLEDLAQYRTNLKLLDGTVINSADLTDMEADQFSPEQIAKFESWLKELIKYPVNITLPDGEESSLEAITIMGDSLLDADQMEAYLQREAPRIQIKMENMGREYLPMQELAELYLRIGEEYGVRGDLAFFQAVKETGYFQYSGSVQPWQNNYCGLWATGNPCSGQESLNGSDPNQVRFEPGVHGAIFSTPEAGVEAHIQHLYAYATDRPLPDGKVLVDPRYSLVRKGIASTWVQLNARWAVPGVTYGQSIICDYWGKAF